MKMEINTLILKSFICDRPCGSILDLKNFFLESSAIAAFADDFYVTQNGRRVDERDEAILGEAYRFHPRLVGGKGGFGSMLRALGAQIEKTTNREACRDLSGRRMRDVNNEKKLKEWIEKAPERERLQREKEEEKKKRKKKEDAKYFFDSTAYDQQKEKIREDLEDAMKQVPGKSPVKRKAKVDIDPSKAKKWFGDDYDDLDSDDDDDEEDEVPSKSKKAKLELKEDDVSENVPEERSVEKEERPDLVKDDDKPKDGNEVPEISNAEQTETPPTETEKKADDSQVQNQSSS